MRVLDLFSGIGGFSLGLERAGMMTVAFCEIDPKCRRVLHNHWPDVPIYDDVTSLTASRLQGDGIEIDVICGGFPCQPFSTAARGRNNKPDLWGHMRRIVGEIRPRWVIAENVPDLKPSGVDRVAGDLEREDYTIWTFDLDTAPNGRQRGRQRFVFVAYSNMESEPRRPLHAQVASLRQVPGRDQEDDAAPLGMDDGFPCRMDRLQQLGNSLSPHASERVGRAIMLVDSEEWKARGNAVQSG